MEHKFNNLDKEELLKILKDKKSIISNLRIRNNSLNNKLKVCRISKSKLKVALEDQQSWFSKQINKFFKDE